MHADNTVVILDGPVFLSATVKHVRIMLFMLTFQCRTA